MSSRLIRNWHLAAALLLLGACGTPQEQCIRSVTHDIRVLDRLITETEGNIRRGYAIDEMTRSVPRWVICAPSEPGGEPQLCLDDMEITERVPRAIDLNVERQKLASMLIKRAELDRAAGPQVAACKARYPQ